MKSSITALLDEHATNKPNSIWITFPETSRQINWQQARDTAKTISVLLQNAGVKPGDSVAIACRNGEAAVSCFLGCVYGGFRATQINLAAGPTAMAYVLDHSQSKLLLIGADNNHQVSKGNKAVNDALQQLVTTYPESQLSRSQCVCFAPDGSPISAIKEQLKYLLDSDFDNDQNGNAQEQSQYTPTENDTALLMYTSGTTGKPKGVLLSHKNLLCGGQNVVAAHKLTDADTSLCILPIYHINGLCVSVMGTMLSASQLIMPTKFSVNQFWALMSQYCCSWFSGVPTHFSYLLNDNDAPEQQLPHFSFARSASAPLAPEIHRRFEQRFSIPIIETMGLTETSAAILSNPMPPAERKIGSPGIAFGNEVKVVDSSLQEVTTGEEGEIVVRGHNVMLGYLNNPAATAEAITDDGWLRSGDIGKMDKDGYIFVTGRLKELIIKGGENIAPREIDEVLLTHEAVLEAAAFAKPCKDYGQRVEACVKLKPEHKIKVTEQELVEYCVSSLGKFKSPDHIHFMAELPKGPSGKVQRLKLAEILGQST